MKTGLDQLMSILWRAHGMPNALTLIAVGGYGRCEMFPYSDIDLLILLPENYTPEDQAKVEIFLGTLWDRMALKSSDIIYSPSVDGQL